MLAWEILESLVSQSFVFSPEWNGYRPSAHETCPKTSFFCLSSVEGKGTPLPFEAPANHLASFFFPLPMSGDPRSLKCKHLCDPQSFLTVTFWLLDNFSSTEGVSFPPPRLREPSRDIILIHLGMVWILFFSLQQWVNSRADRLFSLD